MCMIRFPHVFLLLSVITPLSGGLDAARAESTVTGSCIEIVSDFGDEKLALEALKDAEAAWSIAAGLFGAAEEKPTRPLRVHVYRTIGAYEAAERKRTGGKFRHHLSFSHHADKSAHVALQPPCSDEVLARIGLPGLTQMLIAHEAAHLAVYTVAANYRSHPAWLSEGYATYAAVETHRQGKWSASIEAQPFTSSMMAAARQWAETVSGSIVDELISGRAERAAGPARYGAYWLFFDFMLEGEHRRKFQRFLRQATRMESSPDFAEKLRSSFQRSMGGAAEQSELDRAFRARLRGLKPQWIEPYRSLDIRQSEWVQAAFLEHRAMAWRQDFEKGTRLRIAGMCEIISAELPGATALVLLETNDGAIYVRLTSDGRVEFARDSVSESGDREEILAVSPTPMKRAQGAMRIEIVHDGSNLSASVDGVTALVLPLDLVATGRWGVGVEKGASCIWRNIQAVSMGPSTSRAGE